MVGDCGSGISGGLLQSFKLETVFHKLFGPNKSRYSTTTGLQERKVEVVFWHRLFADYYETLFSNFAQSELCIIRYKAVSQLIFASVRLAKSKSCLNQNKKLSEVNFANSCSCLPRRSTLLRDCIVADQCRNHTSRK